MLGFSAGASDVGRSVIVMVGGKPHPIPSTHPNFAAISAAIESGDEAAFHEATRPAVEAIAIGLGRITDRVSVFEGRLYFDGEQLHSSVANHAVRIWRDHGAESDVLLSFALFLEKLYSNPSDRSRDTLYDWLSKQDFTLNANGDIVGYKSVQTDQNKSWSSGKEPVFVNGEMQMGHISYPFGSEVVMSRDLVDDDPDSLCSVGLHVGNYTYASGFHVYNGSGHRRLLTVAVNPMDVVSVPRDGDSDKMRVCRFVVTGETELVYSDAVLGAPRTNEHGDTVLTLAVGEGTLPGQHRFTLEEAAASVAYDDDDDIYEDDEDDEYYEDEDEDDYDYSYDIYEDEDEDEDTPEPEPEPEQVPGEVNQSRRLLPRWFFGRR